MNSFDCFNLRNDKKLIRLNEAIRKWLILTIKCYKLKTRFLIDFSFYNSHKTSINVNF